ncbi:MAG TPA: L-2-hydroxyglutarate oxidase [Gemmatimonadaceae bacterium]|nr:L-2-hydroxyglutarate oxidase [Gemmatimonadaceae bacterium]
MTSPRDYDFCVVGGGIVGLATAMALLRRHPGASLVLLEKEPALAMHQTGHNSGVIHSGIYYAPGSLKADLCKRGERATKEFCAEHGIPFVTCGKTLVATSALELERMEALVGRARENGIVVERLDAAELRRREPNITGLGALFVPATAIVDYRAVCAAMAAVIRASGGEIALSAPVRAIREHSGGVSVDAGTRRIEAGRLIACAGLQSDRLARMAGLPVLHQIVPFRGEYYRLPSEKNDIISSLIYPIPDPDLPFLGIHLTRMIDGSVTVGPNAVLGFSREGYRKLAVNVRDVAQYAFFPGLWRVLARYRRSVRAELTASLLKSAYLAECRKYCPSLEVRDLLPWSAGIRAQAVTRDGILVHDFLFLESERTLHVCNAPSPAATSAIPIGEMIAGRAGAGAPAAPFVD